MDGGESAEKPAHSDEDEGFTMNFSIEVVEDVAEQVGEMMRLGALGSFKQAREVSDSIDPVNLSTFAVVAEQMRLLFDQGDYTALLEKTKDIGMQLKLTEVQTKMVGTMEKIANAYLWSQSQPDDSEVHDLSYITTLRAAIGHITYLIEQKEVDMEAVSGPQIFTASLTVRSLFLTRWKSTFFCVRYRTMSTTLFCQVSICRKAQQILLCWRLAC
jgi:hypothetical protein